MRNWLLIASIWLPLGSQAADCVRVDGDRIQAGHIARSVAGLEAIPPDTFIGFSPRPGVARWLTPAAIEAVGARFGLRLNVPAAVCVERQAEVLEAAAIRKAMEQSLAKAGHSNASLRVISYPQHSLPVGELEFPLTGLIGSPGKTGEMVWRGRLRLAGSQSIPVRVRVSVSVEVEELRAARAIDAGEMITANDLAMVVRRSVPRSGPASMKLSEAAGMQARRRIDAGQAVLPGMLTAPPEIRKGDSVLVTVAAGGASLGVHAKAETMARKGQPVVLTNPSSGKKFTARATGRGQAVIELEISSHEASTVGGPAVSDGTDASAGRAGRQETARGVGVGQNHR
ncbi:MAG: flagellar basal body P-ring formation protein FlgA [Bryobacteraceae bacterium]|nr:flagellar basal body P-ring formation protein FlgA [Bryobacteraceae bacterium]